MISLKIILISFNLKSFYTIAELMRGSFDSCLSFNSSHHLFTTGSASSRGTRIRTKFDSECTYVYLIPLRMITRGILNREQSYLLYPGEHGPRDALFQWFCFRPTLRGISISIGVYAEYNPRRGSLSFYFSLFPFLLFS